MSAKNKGGRPCKFTPATVTRVLELIAQGVPVRRLGDYKAEGLPHPSVVKEWLVEPADKRTCPVAGFSALYAKAMDERMDNMAEDLLDIADESGIDVSIDDEGNPVVNGEAIARARLRIDTRKWIMGKMAPKKYSDRLKVEGDADAPVIVKIIDDL